MSKISISDIEGKLESLDHYSEGSVLEGNNEAYEDLYRRYIESSGEDKIHYGSLLGMIAGNAERINDQLNKLPEEKA